MTRPFLPSAVLGAAVLCLLVGPVAAPADAREAGRTLQYGHSTAPFWRVGTPDQDLSRLCRRGRFNQRAHNGFYIGYYGGENPGRGYTGIAKQGYNLIDPTGQAEAGVTYHFFNDGYSNCRVYTAPDPAPPQ
ncbi:hypothetical protein [Roseospira goensis]|uniref:Uncharacterized protein n=1 Tax=Roseospira goensis TaxID=391922 RepID=A0A7W6S349_9PROT|nr:hypothetical protein [Roseospira goensis]MBB4287887.1 hypothetical protein [Roseospira goensis]